MINIHLNCFKNIRKWHFVVLQAFEILIQKQFNVLATFQVFITFIVYIALIFISKTYFDE